MTSRLVAPFGAVTLFLLIFTSNVSAVTLSVDQVGAPFRNGGWTGGQVYQSFTPTHTNIAGIDVDFYAFAGTNDLTLRLWGTVVGTGTLLLDITAEDIVACGSNELACQEFRFAPITIIPNEMLFIELVWTGSGAIGGARTTNQNYAGGQLSCPINCGNTLDGDVAFVTYSSVVPVPAAAWLFGSALMGLGWLRRRKHV